MLRLTSRRHGALARLAGGDWGGRSYPARREEPFGVSRGWLIAGLVAVGVGAMAWHYFGPDMKRYLKIHSM